MKKRNLFILLIVFIGLIVLIILIFLPKKFNQDVDLEQNNFEYPPLNPQVNVCVPFQSNLNTRILEKDYFTPKRDCVLDQTKKMLPTSYNLIRGNYVGGPTSCTQTNSCQNIN